MPQLLNSIVKGEKLVVECPLLYRQYIEQRVYELKDKETKAKILEKLKVVEFTDDSKIVENPEEQQPLPNPEADHNQTLAQIINGPAASLCKCTTKPESIDT